MLSCSKSLCPVIHFFFLLLQNFTPRNHSHDLCKTSQFLAQNRVNGCPTRKKKLALYNVRKMPIQFWTNCNLFWLKYSTKSITFIFRSTTSQRVTSNLVVLPVLKILRNDSQGISRRQDDIPVLCT